MRPRRLAIKRHTIVQLGPQLLLVFKPKGQREPPHAHRYAQRLRVLAGRLAVERRRRRVLGPGSRLLEIGAEQVHATEALEDTWVVVESDAPVVGRFDSRP